MTAGWVAALLLGAAVLVAVGLPAAPRMAALTQVGPAIPRRAGTGGGEGRAGRWGRGHTAALGVGLLLTSGPVAAVAGAASAVGAGRWWSSRQRARCRQAERDGAAEALAVLSAELRAGRPTDVAFEGAAEVATGPLAAALRAASDSGRFGADPAACLLAQVGPSAVPDLLRGLAACWQVCAGTGSSLAMAVERLAEGLAADHAQQLQVESELAGPRASATLLALLPLAGLGLAAGLGARPLEVLLHTPIGLACLVTGVALDAAGVLWTAKLIASARTAR